jgi:NH3-dependent NAD+ synthetase
MGLMLRAVVGCAVAASDDRMAARARYRSSAQGIDGGRDATCAVALTRTPYWKLWPKVAAAVWRLRWEESRCWQGFLSWS